MEFTFSMHEECLLSIKTWSKWFFFLWSGDHQDCFMNIKMLESGAASFVTFCRLNLLIIESEILWVEVVNNYLSILVRCRYLSVRMLHSSIDRRTICDNCPFFSKSVQIYHDCKQISYTAVNCKIWRVSRSLTKRSTAVYVTRLHFIITLAFATYFLECGDIIFEIFEDIQQFDKCINLNYAFSKLWFLKRFWGL